jgi:hypothetical protein
MCLPEVGGLYSIGHSALSARELRKIYIKLFKLIQAA